MLIFALEMKKIVFGLLGLVMIISCGRPQKRQPMKSEFRNDVVIKTTPVLDQGRSPLCWAYAMLATIESEHLMQGDSVHLSVDYMARMLLKDEATNYYFNRNDGKVTMRGMASMVFDLMAMYGMLPYDSYYNNVSVDYPVVARTVQQIARASSSLSMLNERIDKTLDEQIGYLPGTIMMLGARYTPMEFAHSVCRPEEYLSLTSFSHHPFGKPFILEVPDNQMRDYFLNVPVDTLMHTIVHALKQGHPVCWEGDISEPGFDFKRGVAVLQNDKADYDQLDRQRAFETFRTTDDHCMELCGLAHDRQGNRFFIAKNSWGPNNRFGGFMYLSYQYVKLKTIAVYLSKDTMQY